MIVAIMQDNPAETRMRGRIKPLIGFPKGSNIRGNGFRNILHFCG